jgi:hypothetical protein
MNTLILNENLKGTGWANARIENGKLIADYHGDILFSNCGKVLSWSGINTFEIFPAKKITEELVDFGSDQKSFVKSNLDYKPLDILTQSF